MNLLFHDTPAKTQADSFAQPLTTVCMYVRGGARTDVRVMREATALAEAGLGVTIVDVDCDQTLPAEEEISGIRVKHIKMPEWFLPVCFVLGGRVLYGR